MRLSRVVCVIEVLLCVQLSEVESNHRRRRIRSLCFRYNTGQSGRSESNRLFRAPNDHEYMVPGGAPFPFIPIFVSFQ